MSGIPTGRRTLVFINGELVDKRTAPPRIQKFDRAPVIIADLKEYRSTVTDEMISGRVAHREHLREHGMREMGDEMPEWMKTHQEVMREAKATNRTPEQINPTKKPVDEVPFSFEDISEKELDALDDAPEYDD